MTFFVDNSKGYTHGQYLCILYNNYRDTEYNFILTHTIGTILLLICISYK